jgi:hypothetical protein
MTREELKLKSKDLEKSELRFFLVPIVAFVVPVVLFIALHRHLDSVPRVRAALGLASMTAWLLFIPVMLRLYSRRARSLGLECPACQKRLAGMNAMVVMSTTRCGFCGHQIIIT